MDASLHTIENKPLNEAEMDRLDEVLVRCSDGNGMGLEEVDGFFSALIAGPETVMPSEYLPEVFGDEIEACKFSSLSEFEVVVGLLMRHWNAIATTLHADEVYLPVLFQDEDGKVKGNDWAHGFMRAVTLRRGAWDDLMDFDSSPGYLFPMMLLVHEHDPDPELRPPPLSPEKREELLGHMGAAPLLVYRHYKDRRKREAQRQAVRQNRKHARFGRNEPCSCGSGKKYKRCHGA